MATDITIPKAPPPKPRAPGIYFGLDETEYHADPSLGSTDIRKLARNPSSYWFDSWMNPNKKQRNETRGQIRGHAMHKLLYEGLPSFTGLYMCGPRHDPGSTPAEKSAATKAANITAQRIGKTVVPADDWDQVMMASAMITKNPKLKDVFTGGFSEVSIFFERDGVPFKVRIDYLKQRGCGDLKGVANEYDKDFKQACREAVARYRYDVQAKHYLDGRALVPGFVDSGQVFGDHDAALLKRIARSPAYAWQWIFYQTEGAPITWSKILSPGNPMLENGASEIRRATANYLQNMETFGNSMWLLIEDPTELYQEDMPGWYAR